MSETSAPTATEEIEAARVESLAARTPEQEAIEVIGEAASALEHAQPAQWSPVAIRRLRDAAGLLRAKTTPLDEHVPDDWKALARMAEGGRTALGLLLGTALMMEQRVVALEAELLRSPSQEAGKP